MTLSDALKVEGDSTRSVLVTFWRSDGIRYTYGATSYFRTFCNPVGGCSSGRVRLANYLQHSKIH